MLKTKNKIQPSKQRLDIDMSISNEQPQNRGNEFPIKEKQIIIRISNEEISIVLPRNMLQTKIQLYFRNINFKTHKELSSSRCSRTLSGLNNIIKWYYSNRKDIEQKES